MKEITAFCIVLLLAFSCKNRDLNEGEAFRPREIHEDIVFHFDKITVDGIEYLILEKDNNNPHEGFGFMAFRANKLMEKQDTVIAYLRTINEVQTRIYSAVSRRPLDQVRAEVDTIFAIHLAEEQNELNILNANELESTNLQLNKGEEEDEKQ